MVPGALDSTQHPQASSAPVPSAEEEALKRNTDCVYFLASPLTCKKGGECEYRHSEYARVNPRDCWYWLNGSCLNPKCAFRHPPLDGLLGTQPSASVGTSLPQQIAVPTPAHSYNNAGRQAVPCIFFQKGQCTRGDKCSFLHGANPIGNKVQQATTTMLPGDLSSSKKPFGFLQKCSQGQKVNVDSSKLPGVQSSGRPNLKAENAAPVNVANFGKSAPLGRTTGEEASRSKPYYPSPVVNGSSQTRPARPHQAPSLDEQNVQNDKDTDEVLRESSPGFDVLVDGEHDDSEYFHGEDQFGRMTTHDRRNLGSMDEYDMDHAADYGSLSEADREILRDRRGYDSFDHMSGQYGWDQLRNPSEVMLGGPNRREGRNQVMSESTDNFSGSDLRHRLSKQRRVDGLKSVVSHDFASESHVDERNYSGSSQRHLPHASSREGSLSSRLKGRVKFPGGSIEDRRDVVDREMDRGRNWGGEHQGRLSNRLKGRIQEENRSALGRMSSGPQMRREAWELNDASFAHPKSLEELKSVGQRRKGRESSPPTMRLQHPRAVDQQSDVDLSFEGPKPLSVLLKRKREAETPGGSSMSVEGSNELVNTSQKIASPKISADVQIHGSFPSLSKEDGLNNQPNKDEATGLTSIVEDDPNPSMEKEDDPVVEDAGDEQELEVDYQEEEGEYEYEQAEEGEYYDGENAEEEYLDDEEGDADFAKNDGENEDEEYNIS